MLLVRRSSLVLALLLVAIPGGRASAGAGRLVAAYAFDARGAAVADLSGNGRTARVAGGRWSAAGRFGGAFVFAGSARIVAASPSTLDLRSGMTLEAWAKPSTRTLWRFGLDGGRAAMRTRALRLVLGRWTSVAATFDGRERRLYLDGTLVGRSAGSGAAGPAASVRTLRIAVDSVPPGRLAGLLDEVRVYDRALAPARIHADMRARVGRSAPAPAPAPTPGPSRADLYVSPSGSDASACTAAAPCLSWNRAYRLAAPGKTVQIAGGAYPGQTLAVDRAKSSATADVTLAVAPGATARLGGDLQILGSHVRVVGPIDAGAHNKLLVDSIPSPSRTHDVTVQGFSGENFVIGPASRVTLRASNFGPSVACRDRDESENKISASTALRGVSPDHVTIDGVTMHDQTTVNSTSCHNGGLNIVGSTYLTIENSKWFKDMVYDIEFDDFTGSFPLHDVTIQNNWFGAPTGALDNAAGCSTGVNCKGEADVQVKWNGVAAQNWLVRFNSFANGFAPEWDGPPPSYSSFRIVANAGGNSWSGSKWMACAPAGKPGVTIAYNAWAGLSFGSAPARATCSPSDASLGPTTNYATTHLPYVSPSVTSPDFHLKPGTAAEAHVTPTSADYELATDIDGRSRPLDRPRDAGSAELTP